MAKKVSCIVSIQKYLNLFEIKAFGKFFRRHIVDIPRKKFFVQCRYRASWPFLDGHYLLEGLRKGQGFVEHVVQDDGGEIVHCGSQKIKLC